MKRKTILIIDDEEPIRVMLRQILEDQQYDVVDAADGEAGLREVAEKDVSLVVTDILMPGREGLQTIRDLRGGHPAVKVIAMSGGSLRIPTQSTLDAARAFGASLVLQKPFQLDELVSAIEGLLNE